MARSVPEGLRPLAVPPGCCLRGRFICKLFGHPGATQSDHLFHGGLENRWVQSAQFAQGRGCVVVAVVCGASSGHAEAFGRAEDAVGVSAAFVLVGGCPGAGDVAVESAAQVGAPVLLALWVARSGAARASLCFVCIFLVFLRHLTCLLLLLLLPWCFLLLLRCPLPIPLLLFCLGCCSCLCCGGLAVRIVFGPAGAGQPRDDVATDLLGYRDRLG